MTQAKAVINLSAGTIELEGPVEFVREYLGRYSPAITGQSTRKLETKSAKFTRVKIAKKKTAGEKTLKAKRAGKALKIITRGKRGRNACARIIHAEIDAGFFNSPVSMKQVDERLKEAGVSCSSGMIRGSLKKAIAEGKIESMGKGRGMVYLKKAAGDEAL